MHAYVLMTGWYDDREPVAVLTDEEAAQAWVEANPAERTYAEVPLNETPTDE